MEVLRLYATGTAVNFPLLALGVMDFNDTPAVFAAGDCQRSLNGGGFVNTTNLPIYIGNGSYRLTLTVAELTAADAAITIIDQTAPKTWEDQAVTIQTYGNAAAGILSVWDEVMEGAFTARQFMRSYAAALHGLVSGGGTTNPKFRDMADTKDRIDATVDNLGNRTAVARDFA